MYYYVWKDEEGNILAHHQTDIPAPPPAIDVGEEEFKRLGFYTPLPPETVIQNDVSSIEEEVKEVINRT